MGIYWMDFTWTLYVVDGGVVMSAQCSEINCLSELIVRIFHKSWLQVKEFKRAGHYSSRMHLHANYWSYLAPDMYM